MKKRLISVLLMFLIVLSSFGLALEDTSDNCAGLWGSVSCFLWGNPSNRAGMSWFDRGNVVGEAGSWLGPCGNSGIMEVGQSCSYNDFTIERLPDVSIGGEDKNNYKVQGGKLEGKTFTASTKVGITNFIPQELYTKIDAASVSTAPKTPSTTATPSSTKWSYDLYDSGWECVSTTCTCENDKGCNVNGYTGGTWLGYGPSEEVTVNKGSTVKNPGGNPKIKKTEIITTTQTLAETLPPKKVATKGTSTTAEQKKKETALESVGAYTLSKNSACTTNGCQPVYYTKDDNKPYIKVGDTFELYDITSNSVYSPVVLKVWQDGKFVDVLTVVQGPGKESLVFKDTLKKTSDLDKDTFTKTSKYPLYIQVDKKKYDANGKIVYHIIGSASNPEYYYEDGTKFEGATEELYDILPVTEEELYSGQQTIDTNLLAQKNLATLTKYFKDNSGEVVTDKELIKKGWTQEQINAAKIAAGYTALATETTEEISESATTKAPATEEKPAETAPTPATAEPAANSLEGKKGYALVDTSENKKVYTNYEGALYYEDGTTVETDQVKTSVLNSDNYNTAKDTAFKSQHDIPKDYESEDMGNWFSPLDGKTVYDSEGKVIEGLTTKGTSYEAMPGYKFEEPNSEKNINVIKITSELILAELKSGDIKTTKEALTQLNALTPKENADGINEMVKYGYISAGTGADEIEKKIVSVYVNDLLTATGGGYIDTATIKGKEYESAAGGKYTDKDGNTFVVTEEGKYTITNKKSEVIDSGKIEIDDIDTPKECDTDICTAIKESQKEAKSLRTQSAFGIDILTAQPGYQDFKEYSSLAGALGAFAQQLGSYQALSNLLVPDATKEMMSWANNEVMNTRADIPGSVSREVCQYDDAKRSKSPGKAAAFIHQPSGTYQFVGQIQAERSQNKAFIMCEHTENPDIPWTCSKAQVCVNELYCHEDKDKNGKPDTPNPITGYFYKITWGVTAPADMKFTPYVDENGVAVAFNIELQGETTKWIFRRGAIRDENVIELKNGASDGGTIVKYLPEDYRSVCIKFGKKVKDDTGNEVKEICADFVLSSKGEVEYGGSDRTASVTSTSPEVSMDI